MLNEGHHTESKDWLSKQFAGLTDTLELLEPSDYIEEIRYMPPAVTPLPGFYSFDVTPYLREIADCFSVHSPVREVALMKGLQVGATALLEGVILYSMGHLKNAPTALMTADDDLAKTRMDVHILPMFEYSGLSDKIGPIDKGNTRKTGRTERKIEWEGGGFLIASGAGSPSRARSWSYRIVLGDEVDAWPISTGKAGDSCDRLKGRTAAYEASRKIFWASTPLITQTSKILVLYNQGDRRKYEIPCKHCNEYQHLEFNKVNADGTCYGVQFTVDEDGRLLEDSVVYMCKFCQGTMINADKSWFLPKGRWVATAKGSDPNFRSYHLPALYSPVGMQSWTAQVRQWLGCWDVINNKVLDTDKLQVFYNEILGAPYTVGGQKLKLQTVNAHRRVVYSAGQIPNIKAQEETGGKIQFVTCTVDVHKKHLDVQTVGWVPGGGFYSIEWFKFEGDCEILESEPWEKLRDIIENKKYIADDGREYRIILTLIDSQYNADVVHQFCSEYISSVFPCRGTELPVKGTRFKEFSEFTSALGHRGYNVTTTIYKDRLATALRREWDGSGRQPIGYPNFPQDYPEQFFKELTIERKVEIKDSQSGKVIGHSWVGRGAHSWDTLVYASAAVDLLAFEICINEWELEEINRPLFWAACEERALFWTAP